MLHFWSETENAPSEKASYFFALKSRQKKWRLENFIVTHHSETHFEAETPEFRCEIKF